MAQVVECAAEKDVCLKIAAIVQALGECGGECDETTLYVVLGCDMQRWLTVKQFLLAGALASVKSHRVRLTAKGLTLAKTVADCEARLAEPAQTAG